MRAHALTTAVTLCLAASLAAAAGAPSSARPESSRTVAEQPAPPVLVDCFWHPQIRPSAFMLACGDGNSRLTSLKWSQWGADSATAQGVNVVNDCKPYCAAGTFHSYAVSVRLDHPRSWKKRPQVRHYTRMTLVFTGARPDTYPPTVRYPLWD
ncbi:hypothetical protein [Streptomyces cylindrosporus]|uniref:Secreted protein n=1 Tax=Streptomyces cylindrosporus TaxID=2927583 RepID=A0ABS9YAH7_9ACTN|nr:hypothetical protein [Streptomyces cylindrosporus]MCI3273974.1 hypothetical protein [Streptomyces cylindrosporus]